MTSLEQAIKDAVEKGGYDTPSSQNYVHLAIGSKNPPDWKEDAQQEFLLDPAFWQALGKARGWPDSSVGQVYKGNMISMLPWEWAWHHLIDHLASGKDVESFFETL